MRSFKRFVFGAVLATLVAAPVQAMMLDYPGVKLQALDKVTARTITFEGKVGATLKFASIFIKIQTCQKPPAYERSDSAAFLQIWEELPKPDVRSEPSASEAIESKWIFSGWMFASSPALSAMDHPIYDVWVVECIGAPVGGDPTLPPPERAEDIEAEEADTVGTIDASTDSQAVGVKDAVDQTPTSEQDLRVPDSVPSRQVGPRAELEPDANGPTPVMESPDRALGVAPR